jgi:phospholipid N-methyltransferase
VCGELAFCRPLRDDEVMIAAESIQFVTQAIRNPGTVGAVLPSSRALARRVMSGIEIDDGEVLLELGPGTGSMTSVCSERLPDPSCYFGIELEPSFVSMLNDRFPALRFVQGSAMEATQHLFDAGIEHQDVRAVICGLPFGSIGPRLQDRMVVRLYKMMQPGTEFRCFQYLHAFPLPLARRFRRRMGERFGPCRVSRPVIANVPPAVVVTWTR